MDNEAMISKLMTNLREQEQYETVSSYLQYVLNEVDKKNNSVKSTVMEIIMAKDSEINELKSKIASLESKNASIEINKSNSNINDTMTDIKSSLDELLSKSDNQDVVKQEEIKDLLTDILAEVKASKEEIIESYMSRVGLNQEEAVAQVDGLVSNETEEKHETKEETTSPFDQVLNNEENITTSAETIAPDASVINSIMPQETPEAENTANNEIQESTPEKVESAEEAPQEVTEAAKNTLRLEPSNIKVVRMGLDSIKSKNMSLKTAIVRNAELPEGFRDHLLSSIKVNDLEQEVGRAR